MRRIYAEAIAATIADEEDRLVQERNLENIRRQEEPDKVLDVVSSEDVPEPSVEENVHVEEESSQQPTDRDREEDPEYTPQVHFSIKFFVL